MIGLVVKGNATVVVFGNTRLLFSYRELVAYKLAGIYPGRAVNEWTRKTETTQRHIREFLGEEGAEEAIPFYSDKKPCDELADALQSILWI